MVGQGGPPRTHHSISGVGSGHFGRVCSCASLLGTVKSLANSRKLYCDPASPAQHSIWLLKRRRWTMKLGVRARRCCRVCTTHAGIVGVPKTTLTLAVTQLVPVVQRLLKGCMRGCRLVHGHLRYGLRQRSCCAVPLFMLITHSHGSGAGSAGVTARRQRLAAKQR